MCHENLDNEGVGDESLAENEDKCWLWILEHIKENRRVISIWRGVYSNTFSFRASRQAIDRFLKLWRRLQWLFFSHTKRGWICKICELYLYSERSSKGAFSTRPCLNTSNPNHAFKNYEKSGRHKKLELKLSSNESSVYDDIIAGAEKTNLNKRRTNHLYMGKCIHSIYFMIQKNIVPIRKLWWYDQCHSRKLAEPITKQHLETCPSNAIYTSYTSAESLADAINFCFESKTPKDIYDARFLTLYVDESENASHKETFSMIVAYLSSTEQKIKPTFLGIVNLKGKTAAEIMDVFYSKIFENWRNIILCFR